MLAKRDKLSEQLSEAGRLKENIDRRSEVVARTLGRYLGHREEAEHRRFLATKVRIIVDSRELQDKIQLAEEQLETLKQQLR